MMMNPQFDRIKVSNQRQQIHLALLNEPTTKQLTTTRPMKKKLKPGT
jgi:hypothetical protein